jgi:hypothetical protein
MGAGAEFNCLGSLLTHYGLGLEGWLAPPGRGETNGPCPSA